jgi:hypothetical protein
VTPVLFPLCPNALPQPTGTILLLRGSSYWANEVCISDKLQTRLLADDIDESEHEWDDDGTEWPNQQDTATVGPKVLTSQDLRNKARYKLRRNGERSRAQEVIGTGLKISALLKYPSSPAIARILVDFDASVNAQVTIPGWVGKLLNNLPSELYTLEQLTEDHKLHLISWDGRYVIYLSFFLYLLSVF